MTPLLHIYSKGNRVMAYVTGDENIPSHSKFLLSDGTDHSELASLLGRHALVKAMDRRIFSGVYACFSDDLTQVGLKQLTELGDDGSVVSEVHEKVIFDWREVACMSFKINDLENAGMFVSVAPQSSGFFSDAQYASKNDGRIDRELKAWVPDEEATVAPSDLHELKPGGWSVEKMYEANGRLGVTSTFKEDLTQYSNTGFVEDPEKRAMADRIAGEIEGNKESARFASLENDDEERDLDKYTSDDVLRGRKKKFVNRSYNLADTRWERNTNNFGRRSIKDFSKPSSRPVAKTHLQLNPSSDSNRIFNTPQQSTSHAHVQPSTPRKLEHNSKDDKPGSPQVPIAPVKPLDASNAWANGPPASIKQQREATSPKENTSSKKMGVEESSSKEATPEVPTVPGTDEPNTETETAKKAFKFNTNAPVFIPASKRVQQVPIDSSSAIMPPPGLPFTNQPPPVFYPNPMMYHQNQSLIQGPMMFPFHMANAVPQQIVPKMNPGPTRSNPRDSVNGSQPPQSPSPGSPTTFVATNFTQLSLQPQGFPQQMMMPQMTAAGLGYVPSQMYLQQQQSAAASFPMGVMYQGMPPISTDRATGSYQMPAPGLIPFHSPYVMAPTGPYLIQPQPTPPVTQISPPPTYGPQQVRPQNQMSNGKRGSWPSQPSRTASNASSNAAIASNDGARR